jgi:hypothetical protein
MGALTIPDKGSKGIEVGSGTPTLGFLTAAHFAQTRHQSKRRIRSPAIPNIWDRRPPSLPIQP